jgi:hypothetical protein
MNGSVMDAPKTRRTRNWEERRRLAASRKPQVRIDRAIVKESAQEQYVFEVVIEGFGLLPALVPPEVTVGGVLVQPPTFAANGRSVVGVLRERPPNLHVVVDLGYARAEGTATFE